MLVAWSSPRSSAPVAWSAATTPTGRCPCEVVERCLANAVRSPSAGFSQGWDFLVLTDAGRARRVLDGHDRRPARRATPGWRHTGGAGAHRCASRDKDAYLDRYAAPDKGWTDRDEARWPVPYWDVDTGMAALLILLTAVDEGLGGLFFGVPPDHHDAVNEAFGIPAGRRIVGVVVHGVCRSRARGARACAGTGAAVARWPTGAVSAWQVRTRETPARRWGVHPLAARSTTRHGPTHDHPASP